MILQRLLQDLEFASVIVQKLNVILITSPELADFRKRLKSLETRVIEFLLVYGGRFDVLSLARWSSFIHNALSVLVSQCRRSIFALLTRTSI